MPNRDFKNVAYIIPGWLLYEPGIAALDIRLYSVVRAYYHACAYNTELLEQLSDEAEASQLSVQGSLFKLNQKGIIKFEDFYNTDDYLMTIIFINKDYNLNERTKTDGREDYNR